MYNEMDVRIPVPEFKPEQYNKDGTVRMHPCSQSHKKWALFMDALAKTGCKHIGYKNSCKLEGMAIFNNTQTGYQEYKKLRHCCPPSGVTILPVMCCNFGNQIQFFKATRDETGRIVQDSQQLPEFPYYVCAKCGKVYYDEEMLKELELGYY